MRLNFVLGTAAELIKVYPVIELARSQGHAVRVIATGQSADNLERQYTDFRLPEEEFRPLLQDTKDLASAGAAIQWLTRALGASKRSFESRLLPGESVQFVIVHGDTLSTLLGAWLGWRSHVDVVHIEAGLRAPTLWHPFPEEITRRLVSRFAKWHMCPDEKSAENLSTRRRDRERIINTQGNTLIETIARAPQSDRGTQMQGQSTYALANLHRFENLNSTERWQCLLNTVISAAQNTKVIFVAHPQTKHKLHTHPHDQAMLTNAGVEIRDRMPFSEFLLLLKGSRYLISDGGSNQEECSYLGHPCLVMRDSTERAEGLGTTCVLSRFDPAIIQNFLRDPDKHRHAPQQPANSPSHIILESLKRT